MVPAQEKLNFPLNLHLTELWFIDFCCDNRGPDGRDVQTALSDRMLQQRHVGRFLVFPVCGVGFNLQDLRFIPTYFLTLLVCMLG
jgi:hypothetical protein